MTDVVDSQTRSRMMAGIQGKNTKPELLIRSYLHNNGFRYRIHSKKLPGKPDLVLNKYRAVIFVNGCFWHGHNCSLFKWPKTREDFWRNKITRNIENDQMNIDKLKSLNWRICIIWECSIKGANKDISKVIKKIGRWLNGKSIYLEVRG